MSINLEKIREALTFLSLKLRKKKILHRRFGGVHAKLVLNGSDFL